MMADDNDKVMTMKLETIVRLLLIYSVSDEWGCFYRYQVVGGLLIEIVKSLNAYLLPFQGEGRDGDGFRVRSKPSPSKSSP